MTEHGRMPIELFMIAVLAALTLLAGGCGDDGDGDGAVPATGEPQQPTALETYPSLEGVDWDPILATTRAKTPPAQAVCPAGASPDIAGPPDQVRPDAAWVGSRAAAFDPAAGEIIYLAREVETSWLGPEGPTQTWTFDVCTNTWELTAPLAAPGEGFGDGPVLVHDVDSGVTLAISNGGGVAVYDAAAKTWTQTPRDPLIEDVPGLTRGAVYDPVSGLVLTTDNVGVWDADERYELWAYEFESNAWTFVGSVPQEAYDFLSGAEEVDLLGHSASIDRLILTTGTSLHSATLLVDPRTGVISRIDIDTPFVFFRAPVAAYGTASDTVFVSDVLDPDVAVCGLDTGATTWSLCVDVPSRWSTHPSPLFSALVGDTINERLVFIHRVFEVDAAEGVADVWAVDVATGEWTELLAPSAFTPMLPDASGVAATGATSFPDPEEVVDGDGGANRLPLGEVTAPAFADRLDFMYERCKGDFCYRDAVFVNPEDPSLVSAAFEANRPFIVRHGFVNEADEPLGEDFDVVVYAYPYGGRSAEGQIPRFTSDYVLRGTADQCGPTYRTQTAPVTCEWFVHEFPDGLPPGRHALWAVWEAPCAAWSDDGFIERCDDPREVMALFASGVDSPWEIGPVEWDPR